MSSYKHQSLLDMVSRPEVESLVLTGNQHNKAAAMTPLVVKSAKQDYFLNTVQKKKGLNIKYSLGQFSFTNQNKNQ